MPGRWTEAAGRFSPRARHAGSSRARLGLAVALAVRVSLPPSAARVTPRPARCDGRPDALHATAPTGTLQRLAPFVVVARLGAALRCLLTCAGDGRDGLDEYKRAPTGRRAETAFPRAPNPGPDAYIFTHSLEAALPLVADHVRPRPGGLQGDSSARYPQADREVWAEQRQRGAPRLAALVIYHQTGWHGGEGAATDKHDNARHPFLSGAPAASVESRRRRISCAPLGRGRQQNKRGVIGVRGGG